jgi:hypothetical protein
MFLVSAIKNGLALLDEWSSLPVMHGGGRQQRKRPLRTVL